MEWWRWRQLNRVQFPYDNSVNKLSKRRISPTFTTNVGKLGWACTYIQSATAYDYAPQQIPLAPVRCYDSDSRQKPSGVRTCAPNTTSTT